LAERFGLKYPSSISFIYQAHCGHASHCSPYSVIIYLRPATAMRRALSSHSLPFQSTESAPLSSPWPNLHGFFKFLWENNLHFRFSSEKSAECSVQAPQHFCLPYDRS
jgi:hypothetical protein